MLRARTLMFHAMAACLAVGLVAAVGPTANPSPTLAGVANVAHASTSVDEAQAEVATLRTNVKQKQKQLKEANKAVKKAQQKVKEAKKKAVKKKARKQLDAAKKKRDKFKKQIWQLKAKLARADVVLANLTSGPVVPPKPKDSNGKKIPRKWSAQHSFRTSTDWGYTSNRQWARVLKARVTKTAKKKGAKITYYWMVGNTVAAVSNQPVRFQPTKEERGNPLRMRYVITAPGYKPWVRNVKFSPIVFDIWPPMPKLTNPGCESPTGSLTFPETEGASYQYKFNDENFQTKWKDVPAGVLNLPVGLQRMETRTVVEHGYRLGATADWDHHPFFLECSGTWKFKDGDQTVGYITRDGNADNLTKGTFRTNKGVKVTADLSLVRFYLASEVPPRMQSNTAATWLDEANGDRSGATLTATITYVDATTARLKITGSAHMGPLEGQTFSFTATATVNK